MLFFLPESPKFNYVKRRFDKTRKALTCLARFNCKRNHQTLFNNVKFETEFLTEDDKKQFATEERDSIVSLPTDAGQSRVIKESLQGQCGCKNLSEER